MNIKSLFNRISIKVAAWAGSAAAGALATALVIAWLVTGPYFHFSNTWLITITVITDVVIFLMVFSIQNTQNRDSKAIQLKLNELISADKKARDTFIGLETLTDEELGVLDDEFKQLLSRIDAHPAIHKLHRQISREKAHRSGLSEQAEHLVDTILGPFNVKHEDKG
jgi:low affinity Fe/Cu permease